jgi:hypothetical protein
MKLTSPSKGRSIHIGILFLTLLSSFIVVWYSTNNGIGFKLNINTTLTHKNNTFFIGGMKEYGTGKFLPKFEKIIKFSLKEHNFNDSAYMIFPKECVGEGSQTTCTGVVYFNLNMLDLKTDINKILEFALPKNFNYSDIFQSNGIKFLLYRDYLKTINWIGSETMQFKPNSDTINQNLKERYLDQQSPFTKIKVSVLPFVKIKYLLFFIYFKAIMYLITIFILVALISYTLMFRSYKHFNTKEI